MSGCFVLGRRRDPQPRRKIRGKKTVNRHGSITGVLTYESPYDFKKDQSTTREESFSQPPRGLVRLAVTPKGKVHRMGGSFNSNSGKKDTPGANSDRAKNAFSFEKARGKRPQNRRLDKKSGRSCN